MKSFAYGQVHTPTELAIQAETSSAVKHSHTQSQQLIRFDGLESLTYPVSLWLCVSVCVEFTFVLFRWLRTRINALNQLQAAWTH